MFVPVDDEVVKDGPPVVVLDAEVQEVSLYGGLAGQEFSHGVPAVLHGAPQQGAVTLQVTGVHHTSTSQLSVKT